MITRGKLSVVSLIAVALSIGASSANAATTFDFQFDASGGGPDGTIRNPIIGTGSFVSPVDLSVGTYALSSLQGFSLQFSFGSDTFSVADIKTPTYDVAVEISKFGSGERMVFTENGPSGDSGPNGGSLDLTNAELAQISFEPTRVGGHNLYWASFTDSNYGNYLAVSAVPVPASLPMFSAALLCLAGLGMRSGCVFAAERGQSPKAEDRGPVGFLLGSVTATIQRSCAHDL